jgi:uncharacterized repeat protein (TIGR03803 family)
VKPTIKTASLFLLVLAAVAITAIPSATAQAAFQVLHSFSGPDGGSPNALFQNSDGFFYGSAANGGDVNSCPSDGCGTLIKFDSAGHFVVLHTFHGTDGVEPTGLIKGLDGNFYGTTAGGTLFRMDTAGNFSVLYTFVGGFACCDGAGPTAQPLQAADGNFYGTTHTGGAYRDIEHQTGFGTVYRFNPTTGVVSIIHSFSLADGNGVFPNGPLVQANDGFLYGTTREGGVGGGTVFKIDTAGNLTLLHAFADNLSAEPLSGLIQASDGFFYGTTEGAIGAGIVYRVDANGNYTLINQFDGTDGYKPHWGLLQAADGFFYGTAPEGGFLDFQGGDVFRLNALGGIRVLHSFTITGAEGFIPNSKFIQGADGALYGVNGIGGVGGRGTIFRIDQRVAGPVVSITVNPTVVHSGQTSTGTVTLSSPAPAGGRIVNLRANSFQMTLPLSVKVRPGAKTANFTIKAFQVGAAQTVRIYASFGGQGVRTKLKLLP